MAYEPHEPHNFKILTFIWFVAFWRRPHAPLAWFMFVFTCVCVWFVLASFTFSNIHKYIIIYCVYILFHVTRLCVREGSIRSTIYNTVYVTQTIVFDSIVYWAHLARATLILLFRVVFRSRACQGDCIKFGSRVPQNMVWLSECVLLCIEPVLTHSIKCNWRGSPETK